MEQAEEDSGPSKIFVIMEDDLPPISNVPNQAEETPVIKSEPVDNDMTEMETMESSSEVKGQQALSNTSLELPTDLAKDTRAIEETVVEAQSNTDDPRDIKFSDSQKDKGEEILQDVVKEEDSTSASSSVVIAKVSESAQDTDPTTVVVNQASTSNPVNCEETEPVLAKEATSAAEIDSAGEEPSLDEGAERGIKDEDDKDETSNETDSKQHTATSENQQETSIA
ncbi:hypothetical protein BSL78_25165 [Apostichopus japonicus]|uniref:Uncharacterized protein n=1 Tax=Stichopus japonicus TaxID=307972 RepID=A0A2G8JQL2_STIJA|nr:hypothetical protein BSL78_25165 [Apostichopus japonicus]